MLGAMHAFGRRVIERRRRPCIDTPSSPPLVFVTIGENSSTDFGLHGVSVFRSTCTACSSRPKQAETLCPINPQYCGAGKSYDSVRLESPKCASQFAAAALRRSNFKKEGILGCTLPSWRTASCWWWCLRIVGARLHCRSCRAPGDLLLGGGPSGEIHVWRA